MSDSLNKPICHTEVVLIFYSLLILKKQKQFLNFFLHNKIPSDC